MRPRQVGRGTRQRRFNCDRLGLFIARVAIGAVGALALAASPAGAASFNWTGLDPSDGAWSHGANWLGGTAPSGSVDALNFPTLTTPECAFPYSATCYEGQNDLVGLSAQQILIAGGVPYRLSGNEVTLGSGGISSSFGDYGSGPIISFPIDLAASQTWHINREALTATGGITGGSAALTFELKNSGGLSLRGQNESGPVTVQSLSPVSGNGALDLGGDTTTLNGLNGNPVYIDHVRLDGVGTVGELTTSDSQIVPDGFFANPVTSPYAITANGTMTLDPGSTVSLSIAGSQVANGSPDDYSELKATGDVDLASASLEVRLGTFQPFTCPPPQVAGRTYTLVETTGTLTGTFAGVPEGTEFLPRQVEYFDEVPEPGYRVWCPIYPLRIHYAPNAVEATVLVRPPMIPPGNTGGGTTGGGVGLTSPAPTGQQAAALKRCKRKESRKARRRCRRKASRLPV